MTANDNGSTTKGARRLQRPVKLSTVAISRKRLLIRFEGNRKANNCTVIEDIIGEDIKAFAFNDCCWLLVFNTSQTGDLLIVQAGRVESKGEYNWGGFFYTKFWIDPKEKLIAVMMSQLNPNIHLDIDKKLSVLTYQAIID